MPAMPKISPARTEKLTSWNAPLAPVKPSTRKTSLPAGSSIFGKMRSTLRPTMFSSNTFTGTWAEG
jgi:hypothetical protein